MHSNRPSHSTALLLTVAVCVVTTCSLGRAADLPPAIAEFPASWGFALHPTEPSIALHHEKTLQVFDLRTKEAVFTAEVESRTVCLEFSPTGKWLAVGDGSKLRVWDTTEGNAEHLLESELWEGVEGGPGQIRKLFFDRDEERLTLGIAGSRVDAVILAIEGWSVVERLVPAPEQRPEIWEEGVLRGRFGYWAISPDETMFVRGDQVIRIWLRGKKGWGVAKVLEREPRVKDDNALGASGVAAFDPRGRALVHSRDEGLLRLLRAKDLKEVAAWKPQPGQILSDLAFTPDGGTLITCGRTLRVWRVKDQKLIVEFRGRDRDAAYRAVDIAANGERIAVHTGSAVRVCSMKDFRAAWKKR